MKMRNRFKFMKYNKKYACLFGEIIRIDRKILCLRYMISTKIENTNNGMI